MKLKMQNQSFFNPRHCQSSILCYLKTEKEPQAGLDAFHLWPAINCNSYVNMSIGHFNFLKLAFAVPGFRGTFLSSDRRWPQKRSMICVPLFTFRSLPEGSLILFTLV